MSVGAAGRNTVGRTSCHHSHPLIYYFATCGLSADSINTSVGDNDSLPTQTKYSADTLCHFPKQRPSVSYDSTAVTRLAVPNGIHFCTKALLPTAPSLHCFLITQENGRQVYGTALEFYQVVEDDTLKDMVLMLQDIWKINNSEDIKHISDYVWDGLEELYVSKTLVLLLSGPYPHFGLDYLTQLLAASQLSNGMELVQSHLQFMLDIEYPSSGVCLTVQGPIAPVACSRPSNRLRISDFHISSLLKVFSMDDLLKVVAFLLLEGQVLLVSEHLHTLTAVAECLSSLVFPFEWQHVFAPILPCQQLDLLDAPVPFIMGLQSTPEKATRSTLDLPEEVSLLNADTGHVDLPFPDKLELPEDRLLRKELAKLIDCVKSDCSLCTSRPLSRGYLSTGVVSPVYSGSDLFNENMVLFSVSGISPKPLVLSKTPQQTSDFGVHTCLCGISLVAGKSCTMPRRESATLSRDHTLDEDVEEEEATSGFSLIVSSGSTRLVVPQYPRPELAELMVRSHAEHERQLGLNARVQEAFSKYFQILLADYQVYMVDVRESKVDDAGICFDSVAFLSDRPSNHSWFFAQLVTTQAFAAFTESKFLEDVMPLTSSRLSFEESLKANVRSRTQNNMGSVSFSFRKVASSLMNKGCSQQQLFLQPPNPQKAPLMASLTESMTKESPMSSKGINSLSTSRIASTRAKRGMSDELNDVDVPIRARSGQASHEQVVNRLLDEAKSRVKRLILGKMGREGFMLSLGHIDSRSMLDQEEQTSIAALCDLLERIWSHGAVHRRKSTASSMVWDHLLRYRKHSRLVTRSTSYSLNLGSALNQKPSRFGFSRAHTQMKIGPPSPAEQTVHRFCNGQAQSTAQKLVDHISQVRNMAEIKSGNGYARALIKLALEKKVLTQYLEQLLQDHEVIGDSYRPYAFLLQEEKTEQLLGHLLSLTTVDITAFRNAYLSAAMVYTIIIISKSPLGYALSVDLFGATGKICNIEVPANTQFFQKKSANLGGLEGVMVSNADRQSISTKVQSLYVLCEQTELCYKLDLECWEEAHDVSSVLLLCVEEVTRDVLANNIFHASQTQPSELLTGVTQSHSAHSQLSRQSTLAEDDIGYVENLASSVNLIAKHIDGVQIDMPHNLQQLLWGRNGFAFYFMAILGHGLKSKRMLRTNRSIWSVLEAMVQTSLPLESDGVSPAHREAFCSTVRTISTYDCLGAHAKALLLVCEALRMKSVKSWFMVIHTSPVCLKLYNDTAAIRDPEIVQDVCDLLQWCTTITLQLPLSIETFHKKAASVAGTRLNTKVPIFASHSGASRS